MDIQEELASAKQKAMKTTCCKSYQLPKGRCFDCVERALVEERVVE